MGKSIIKGDDTKGAVIKEKTEINKSQTEESQKKAVEKTSAIKKSVTYSVDDTDPHVAFRDYSGRIKYDAQFEQNKNTSAVNSTVSESNSVVNEPHSDVIRPQDTSSVIKTERIDNSSSVRTQDTTGAFRESTADVTGSIRGGAEASPHSVTGASEAFRNTVKESYKDTADRSIATAYRYKQAATDGVVRNTAEASSVVRSADNTGVVKGVSPAESVVKSNERYKPKTNTIDGSVAKDRSGVVADRQAYTEKPVSNAKSRQQKIIRENIRNAQQKSYTQKHTAAPVKDSYVNSADSSIVKDRLVDFTGGESAVETSVSDTKRKHQKIIKENIRKKQQENYNKKHSIKPVENSYISSTENSAQFEQNNFNENIVHNSGESVNVINTFKNYKSNVKAVDSGIVKAERTDVTVKSQVEKPVANIAKDRQQKVIKQNIRQKQQETYKNKHKPVEQAKTAAYSSYDDYSNNFENIIVEDSSKDIVKDQSQNNSFQYTESSSVYKSSVKRERSTVYRSGKHKRASHSTKRNVTAKAKKYGVKEENGSVAVKSEKRTGDGIVKSSSDKVINSVINQGENSQTDGIPEEIKTAEAATTIAYVLKPDKIELSQKATFFVKDTVEKLTDEEKHIQDVVELRKKLNIKENISKIRISRNTPSVKNAVASASASGIIKPSATTIYASAVNNSNKASPSTAIKKRGRKINKKKVAEAKKNLGIKDEVRNQLKKAVLQDNIRVRKAVRAGGSSILKNIKGGFEEAGDYDMGLKGIDDIIKVTDTAIGTKRGIKAAINTTKSAEKALKSSTKAAVSAPKKVVSGAKKLKQAAKKVQRFKQLSTTRKLKLTGTFAKATFRKAAQVLASSAKAAAVKVCAVFLVWLLIIVLIVGAVIAALGAVIWQTPSDLDTTQIVKYISELDYNQQQKWFSKGSTAVDIDKKNSTGSNSYSYYYCVAEDVPIDKPNADGSLPAETSMHCVVHTYQDNKKPTYRGFNKLFTSSDEMVEYYRWTTDDYRAALAYLQVKNENLGWLATAVGWVGEMQLKNAAAQLHSATYQQQIVIKADTDSGTNFTYQLPIYSTSVASGYGHYYYFFGRKYSVKYLIDNDIVRFDDDDTVNAADKEMFENVYQYGNIAVSNLQFPLELQDGQKISDRISKHFGKQLVLKYTPPEDDEHYGKVTSTSGWHMATDLSANAGDVIYAPIGGLCTVKQSDERGFEFTITTSYSGVNPDYTKDGYVVRLSCAGTSYISTAHPTVVRAGQPLGKVCANISCNYKIPDHTNDTANEDIFASRLFPCSTDTDYSSIGQGQMSEPNPRQDHLHIEEYKLPCDFNDVADIEKNVLAPELFFDYSSEAN